MIRRILNISFWVIAILALLAFEIYALRQNGDTTCNELQIELNNKYDYPQLTSKEELRTEILQN